MQINTEGGMLENLIDDWSRSIQFHLEAVDSYYVAELIVHNYDTLGAGSINRYPNNRPEQA